MLLASCAHDKPTTQPTTNAKNSASTGLSSYSTTEQFKAMPPCQALVEHHGTCWVLLRATDGNKFYLDGLTGTEEVARFVSTLTERQTYKLPSAFFDYLKDYREEK